MGSLSRPLLPDSCVPNTTFLESLRGYFLGRRRKFLPRENEHADNLSSPSLVNLVTTPKGKGGLRWVHFGPPSLMLTFRSTTQEHRPGHLQLRPKSPTLTSL